MPTFGILTFTDAEELDFVGPWEVFAASAALLDGGTDSVVLIAETSDVVRCSKGLRVVPDRTFDNHPPLDVVLVPGGVGTRVQVENSRLLEWLAKTAATATWTTSVCTGSLLLARSGAADGKRVATHWGFEDTLDQEPNVTVVRNERWVVDGSVVSSQGVSAGIDMTLWLIGQIHGPDHARRTQHYIQYDPAPPYQDIDAS